MRQSDWRKLYVPQVQVDGKTGKEKTVLRYIGPWYTTERKPKKICALVSNLGWVLGMAAFVTAGLVPSWAGLCGYVTPWLLLCLLPLFYLALGSIKLVRLKEKFTEEARYDSLGYIRVNSVILTALAAAWSIATIIFLLLNDCSMTLPQELIFLGCGLVTTAIGLVIRFTVTRVPITQLPEPSTEPSAESATPTE